MMTDVERSKVLEMIEDGSITAEEGLRLLQALEESASGVGADSEVEALPEWTEPLEIPEDGFASRDAVHEPVEVLSGEPVPPPPPPEEIKKWRRWWVIPFYVGVGITVLGAALMYWVYSASGVGFWFACMWFPFLIGVAVMALAWSSRNAPWLHVRIHQAPGETPQRIAISFPLPVRLSAWGLRTFGHHIPNLDATGLDEVIKALGDSAKEGTPFFVDVNEGEDGEHVQVFIG